MQQTEATATTIAQPTTHLDVPPLEGGGWNGEPPDGPPHEPCDEAPPAGGPLGCPHEEPGVDEPGALGSNGLDDMAQSLRAGELAGTVHQTAFFVCPE